MSDEERDLRKYSRRSAIGLMGVGGGLAATETLGFTNLTADRGVDLSVEDDTNATLKITVSGGDEDGNALDNKPEYTDPLTVEFENTGSTEITLDTVEATDTNGDTGISSDFNDEEVLNESQSTTVEFSLDETTDDRNEATADVSIEATIGSGASLDITRADITIVDPAD